MTTEHTNDNELIIHGSPALISDIGVRLNIGQPVGGDLKFGKFKYEKSNKSYLADNIAAPGFKCLLFKKEIKCFLENSDVKNLQYFEILLEDDNQDATICYMTNVIGSYDIVDYDKSDIELDDGKIEFIDSLSFIDTSEIYLPPIFRLSSFLPLIIVNDYVRGELEKNKFSGLKFYKPEEFSL